MNIESDFSFTDEHFMSAAEKRLTLSAWKTFLKNGCKLEHFTERLYYHLTQHCSFIAHYDRHGFYGVYFKSPNAQTIGFLDQFDPNKPGISAEYGDTWWLNGPTGCDLSRAMRQGAAPYLPKLRYQFERAERESDLDLAALLLAKHGKKIMGRDGSSGPATDLFSPTISACSEPRESAEEQLSIFPSAD